MTLHELSLDYYNTCAGLTERIESLRRNRLPDDADALKKINHYVHVRGELRAQARILEHYYDREHRHRSARGSRVTVNEH